MSVTLELSPEVEASLAALAQEQGLSLPEYLQRLLGEGKKTKPLSPAERAEAWIEAAKNLPETPAVVDDSRETIYSSRG